jgi:transposase
VELLEKLKKEIEYLSSKIADQEEELKLKNNKIKVNEERILELSRLNDWYIEQLKLRQKEKFGKSSEKVDEAQLSLFDLFNEAETLKEPIAIEPTVEEVFVKSHTKKKRKRGECFANLPVEIIEYKIDDEDLVCPKCDGNLTEMKKEVRTEIQIIPAKVKKVEHITYVYSCRLCDKEGDSGFIIKADSPKALIPKSIVSSSFLSYIINQKFALALPLYRQEQEFKRLDMEISRQNLSNWILKGAALLNPLYLALKMELLRNYLIHADETTLEVLNEPGRECHQKSYMWVYRTSTACQKPVILYDYQIGRSGDYAKEFLKDWKGEFLHCDGYAGYKKIKDKTLCGCFAHAKRKFHEAYKINKNNHEAKKCEEYISKLFALEHKADDASYSLEERLLMRQTESSKLIEEFYNYINIITLKTLPQSLLGKAITYAINQKEYLTSFLKDARIQLSNNLAEQAIKMFVIGRKNWLFSNTPNGASASATIYSIIQTAIANNLKPYDYLNYVFSQIQLSKDLQIEDLLPWSDKIPEECKNTSI